MGAYQSVNGTRIVKYVEPSDIEDVFKVTVAVERTIEDADLTRVLTAMPSFIINENKNKVDSPVGTIIEPKEYQNGDSYGSTDELKALDTNDYFYVHYQYSFTENGKVIIRDLGNIKMYRAYGKSSGQNHGIIGLLPNGKWIVIDSNDFKWDDHSTHNVALSEEQYEALVDAATPEISVSGVTDYLDTDRFIYLGTEGVDTKAASGTVPTVSLANTTASAPGTNGIITWSGAGWSDLSVSHTAKMSYYVRLKTSTLDSASTNISQMSFKETGPVDGTGMAYGLAGQKAIANVIAQQPVIETSTGNGTTIIQKTTACTIEASQPSVKGLLYYIQIEKASSEDKNTKLANAVFHVYSGNETSGNPVATITTGADGLGTSSPGLPWGTYTLVEKTAPSGYSKTWTSQTYNLAYLGDSTGGTAYVAEVVDDDKPGKSLTGDLAITNEPSKEVPITFIKVGIDNEAADAGEAIALGGARFELYKVEESNRVDITNSKLLSSSADGTGIFSVEDMTLENGSYVLVETRAPDGYYQIVNELSFLVDTDKTAPEEKVTTVSSSSNIEISFVTENDETHYTIKIINRAGVELPHTGGTGTLPYTLGGLGCILLFFLLYGYSLRYKRERRSK